MENIELLTQWKNGLRVRHIAHSKALSYYSSMDRIIGLLSTLFTAVVATTIFASMNESQEKTLILIAGLISILATLASAANAFLKYGELAERHKQAVASFGSLRRELETMLMQNNIAAITTEKLQEFNINWSKLEESVPALPQRFQDNASKIVHQGTKDGLTAIK